MWKKSADPSPPPPPVGPPLTSSHTAADASRRFRRSPLLDEDEMSGLPSHAEGWSTLFDEFPRLLRDVRRNAHIRADAELRGIRAYDADADAKRGAPYYSSRNLHRRDVLEPSTAADSVPKVLQPGRGFFEYFRQCSGSGSNGSTCFGPPGSICQRYGSGSFYHQAKIVRKTLIPTVLHLLLDFS
jgi:hypothetical protein